VQPFLPPFGPTHLLILLAVVFISGLVYVTARSQPRLRTSLRWLLALVSAGLGLTWYAFRIWSLHEQWKLSLPLEVCDVALWVTVAALVLPRQRLLELAYFWGLSGATVALLTPYLVAPLISVTSITFLAGHGIIVVDVFYLLGVRAVRLAPQVWSFSFAAINVLMLFDLVFDRLSGANYMYLLHKPPIRSLLDVMGPWPLYIVSADVLAAAIFIAMQWPFCSPFPHPRSRRTE